jgi:hypothetical protein
MLPNSPPVLQYLEGLVQGSQQACRRGRYIYGAEDFRDASPNSKSLAFFFEI